jgi:hypothetical protein
LVALSIDCHISNRQLQRSTALLLRNKACGVSVCGAAHQALGGVCADISG